MDKNKRREILKNMVKNEDHVYDKVPDACQDSGVQLDKAKPYYPETLDPLEKPSYVGTFIEAYYNYHPTGGNLHIVLDDGNTDDENIKFCHGEALSAGDWFGVAIATYLLNLQDEDRLRAIRFGGGCVDDWSNDE